MISVRFSNPEVMRDSMYCPEALYLKTSDLATNGDEYGVAWVTFECNSIESVEQSSEKMFKNLNGCYYERWNER